MERVEWSDQENIRTLEKKENLQILGNIGSGPNRTSGEEKIILKEYLSRTRHRVKNDPFSSKILRRTRKMVRRRSQTR